MYTSFFGLRELPFSLTPDPGFIVFTPSYNEVLSKLYYNLNDPKGLIILTGEVGTGKTTALRWILNRLDSRFLVATFSNPHLSCDDFYHHITMMLRIDGWDNKSDMLFQMGNILENRCNQRLKTIIIVDEAQGLGEQVLEEIRLLLNFESDKYKFLQIVLCGQEELVINMLRRKSLRQLKQRISSYHKIHPLRDSYETEIYITERLVIAGSEQPNIFTPGAIDLIFECSEGLPRQINTICDNAMLMSFTEGETIIGRAVIEEVAENLYLIDPQ
jgi:general secretion pathway protein A